jgi:hypothetical protein
MSNMSQRTWIPIVSVPLGFPTKHLTITRGVPGDVKVGNTKVNSVYSLQITIDYSTKYQASIPLLSEVVSVLKQHLESTLTIPPYGYFLESDGRHYVILENKNKDVTLSFERNKYRNTIRLSADEIKTILRYNQLKLFLQEKGKTKTVFDKSRPDIHGDELSTWIQYWTAMSIKTPHELGTCDCADVTEGWPCELSGNRNLKQKMHALSGDVAYYAETLKNIQHFRDLLGVNIPFDGFSDRLWDLACECDKDDDYCLLVRSVMKHFNK